VEEDAEDVKNIYHIWFVIFLMNQNQLLQWRCAPKKPVQPLATSLRELPPIVPHVLLCQIDPPSPLSGFRNCIDCFKQKQARRKIKPHHLFQLKFNSFPKSVLLLQQLSK
jgi:hypothetical protein